MRQTARWTTVLLACALWAAALPLVAGADSPGASYRLVTRQVTFVHDSETYRLRLFASSSGDDDRVSVRIARARNPDGAGPLRSVQSHMYFFDAANMVAASASGDGLTIDTGERIAPYGAIDMAFTADTDATASCGDLEHTRGGELTGAMAFKTHSPLGTIEVSSVRAKVTKHEPEPCPHGDPPDTCPQAGWFLLTRAGRSFGATVMKRPQGARATVSARRDRSLALTDEDSWGYVARDLTTWLPADRARLTRDMSKAVVRGAPGTDTPGRLVFDAATDIRRASGRCETNRRFVMRSRRGTLSGSMVFDFFLGADRDLAQQPLAAHAYRLRVERR